MPTLPPLIPSPALWYSQESYLGLRADIPALPIHGHRLCASGSCADGPLDELVFALDHAEQVDDGRLG